MSLAPPHLLIQVPQAVVEEAAREAAEAQVGAEARGAGQQGVGVHSGSLIVGNPGLQREEKAKKGEAWTLQRTTPRHRRSALLRGSLLRGFSRGV